MLLKDIRERYRLQPSRGLYDYIIDRRTSGGGYGYGS